MKAFVFAAAVAFSLPAFAQSSGATTDENATKAQPPAAEGADRSAASGSSARGDDKFTHGESKRCENLSGDEKVLCDKEEATKSQGQNAEELSKSAEPRPMQRQ